MAEGVENTEQEATLRALGCEAAQGFHYSRPVPWTNCWFWLFEREERGASRSR